MAKSLNRQLVKSCLLGTLLAIVLSPGLSAFQQGSFFLFDIREDGDKASSAGRIVIAKSVFKKKSADSKTQIAKEESKKSEFEAAITVFETKETGKSDSKFQLLDDSVSGSDTESVFDENPQKPAGFYFTY